MPANAIPTVDLDTWRTDPAAVAAQVDTALQRAGFLLVTATAWTPICVPGCARRRVSVSRPGERFT